MATAIKKQSNHPRRSRRSKKEAPAVPPPSPPAKEISAAESPETIEETPFAWLTIETTLYAITFMVALALRLWNLDAVPLSDVEAQQGLAALALYRGQPVGIDGAYSPLLATLGTLSFFLLNDSATAARLVTALLGSVLVLLPVTLRNQLGQKTSLLATMLLAVSPTAIFLSRTLNSEIGVALGALLMLIGFFNWAKNGQQGWLYLSVFGLAFLLTSGAMAVSVLIIFGGIIAIRRAAFKDLWNQGLEQAESHNAVEPSDDESAASKMPSSLRRAAVFFAVALVALATTTSFNLAGFGQTTNQLTGWLSRFGFTPRPGAGFNAIFLLTIYEPLLVFAGFVGLAYAVLSKDLLRQFFVGWFVGMLVLDLVMADRPPGAVILALVPLVFLAGLALAELWKSLQEKGAWSNEGIILAAGLVIATFGYIGLTGWLVRPCGEEDTFCRLAWLQPGAALALFLVILIFFWFISGPGATVRGAALAAVVIGIIATFSITWRLNYGPLMNLVYQPLAGIPVSTELQSLADTLSSEAVTRSGDKDMLDISTVGRLSPALQWQLRNYTNTTQFNSVVEAPATIAIITPASETTKFNLGESYIGQDFAISARWSPVGLQPKDLINWLIYREINVPPEKDEVILWLRVD